MLLNLCWAESNELLQITASCYSATEQEKHAVVNVSKPD